VFSTNPILWAPELSRTSRNPLALIRREAAKHCQIQTKIDAHQGSRGDINLPVRYSIRGGGKSDLRLGRRGRRLLALCDLAAGRGKRGIPTPEALRISFGGEHRG
jgi:hypothetical protein